MHFKVEAQDMYHSAIWSRLSVQKSITPKWQGELELQYRRQDNTQGDFAALPLTKSIRAWAYCKLNDKFRLAISPFAFFENNFPALKNNNMSVMIKEYRMQLNGEFTVSIIKKIDVLSRLSLEPIKQDISGYKLYYLRNRLRESFVYKINTSNTGYTSGELFLNTIYTESMPLFNQLRWTTGWQHTYSKHLSSDIAFMYQQSRVRSMQRDMYSYNAMVNIRWNI